MSLILTQHEADTLLALEKHYQGEERFFFPGLGGAIRIPLYSADRREEFSLDITRGRIVLEKNTFQSRARKAVILARLDLGGHHIEIPMARKSPARICICIGKATATNGR